MVWMAVKRGSVKWSDVRGALEGVKAGKWSEARDVGKTVWMAVQAAAEEVGKQVVERIKA